MFVKFESLNPTGSSMDGGMPVAVREAVAGGSRGEISTSMGNAAVGALDSQFLGGSDGIV